MAEIICVAVLSFNGFFNQQWINSYPEMKESKHQVCVEVASKAIASNVDPVIAVALSLRESSFKRNLRSKAGAIGPLQVIPRWTCPGGERKGCDLVQAGINTLHKHAISYGCGKEMAEIAREKKHWGKFNDWWYTQPICKEVDWLLPICHYNSGNKCLNKRFPRLVLSTAKKIRELIDEVPQNEEKP